MKTTIQYWCKERNKRFEICTHCLKNQDCHSTICRSGGVTGFLCHQFLHQHSVLQQISLQLWTGDYYLYVHFTVILSSKQEIHYGDSISIYQSMCFVYPLHTCLQICSDSRQAISHSKKHSWTCIGKSLNSNSLCNMSVQNSFVIPQQKVSSIQQLMCYWENWGDYPQHCCGSCHFLC